MRFTSLLVSAAVCLVSASAGRADPVANPQGGDPDEQQLRAAGLPINGPGLVEFFRQRARLDADVAEMTAWARRLGDSDAGVRARAAAALVGRGGAALPVLRRAINDLDDPARAARARRCAQLIEGEGAAGLPAAAARVLARCPQAGAVEALLAYLPAAEAEVAVEEAAHALATLAYPDGKPHPALLRALTDEVPLRRAVAGSALVRKRAGSVSDGVQPSLTLPARKAVHKLLDDGKPLVRLRVALALVEVEDAEAVPVLIDLLTEVPPEQQKRAEDVLHGLAGDWAPHPPSATDAIARGISRDAWAAWWRRTDGPALLAEFRRRTLGPADHERVAALIEKLGDEDFAARQSAGDELIAFGPLAVPLLTRAAHGADLERVRRAEECLREIAARGGKPLPLVAARLLALRKPAGTVAVLLDYLPFAEDEALSGEVQATLAALALRAGTLDPALVRALEDKVPVRRAAAAEAILKAGGREQEAAVRKLLRDADQQVRLRVALALALRRDKEAIPVLIEALAEEPSDWNGQAQELLYQLAGDKGPKVEPAADTAGRRKLRDAWAGWWKGVASTIDLAAVEGRTVLVGYTLLVLPNGNNPGRVEELGRDGKPLWSINDLQFPVDAHVLGGNRVLVAEWGGRRVTERDFKGKILWQKEGLAEQPVNAQRLPNGNTFIATASELLEVDRAGKTVWSRPYAGVAAACKSRDGVIWCLTNANQCVRLLPSGKELKTFPSGRSGGYTSGIDGMPNNRVLIAQPPEGTVAEVDGTGTVIRQIKAPGVTSGTHLPNGHVLVASADTNRVVEMDQAGKVVWEHKADVGVFRARRR